MARHDAYRAAVEADDAFSRELRRVYGKHAGDMRYKRGEYADAQLQAAAERKLAADRVMRGERARNSQAGSRGGRMQQKKFPFARGPADKELKDAYAFFKTFGGGGRVGHAAEDSMNLARAERVAEERGWKTSWHDEEADWADYLGEFTKPDEVESVQYCVLKDADGHVIGSLGGIVWLWKSSTAENRNYARFVEAELALEAADGQDLL